MIPLRQTSTMTPPASPSWSHAAEMRSARLVQSRLFPGNSAPRTRLEYAGICLPERGVGGDFYDVIAAGPGRTALVIGDVSGKGVPAALMMATLRACLRSHYALDSGDLARRLESVNRFFFECTAAEHYASLFVGELDEGTGRLRYANCGHVPPIVARAGLQIERLGATSTVLGLFDTWSCATAETTLGEGDVIALASDGVTEAAPAGGDGFGDERLVAALLAHRDLRAGALVRAIADEARAFRGSAPGDDLTLVAARVSRRPAGVKPDPGD